MSDDDSRGPPTEITNVTPMPEFRTGMPMLLPAGEYMPGAPVVRVLPALSPGVTGAFFVNDHGPGVQVVNVASGAEYIPGARVEYRGPTLDDLEALPAGLRSHYDELFAISSRREPNRRGLGPCRAVRHREAPVAAPRRPSDRATMGGRRRPHQHFTSSAARRTMELVGHVDHVLSARTVTEQVPPAPEPAPATTASPGPTSGRKRFWKR